MTTSQNPLDGPFMSRRDLTRGDDLPGFAKPQPVLQAKLAVVRHALEAAGEGGPSNERVMGVYSDWLEAVTQRHTAQSLAQFATRKAAQ